MSSLQNALLFGVPLALSASTLAWMHWYPWNRGTKPLDLLPRYVMGTSVVVGFPILAMLVAYALDMAHDALWWAALLAANTIVSGATVKATYWIDESLALTTEELRQDERSL